MQIQVNIDTDNKTISLVADGQVVSDVCSFCAYADKYGFSCDFARKIDDKSSESYRYSSYATQGAFANKFEKVDASVIELEKILKNVK